MRTCYKTVLILLHLACVIKWLNISAELITYTIRMNNPKVAYKVSDSSHNF